MSQTGFFTILCACIGLSSACNMQEIGFERDEREIEFERDGQDYIDSTRQKYEVNSGGTLTVDAKLAAIRIRSSINDEVDVLVRKRFRATDADQVREAFSNIEVVIEQTYNGVRIEVDWIRYPTYTKKFWQDDWPDRVYVDINVVVPEEYNLDLITISGDIQTGNIAGNVTAETLTGEISTGPTEGDLSIKSNSGNIETSRVVGRLHTTTLTGNIKIGPVDGDATVDSNSGRIETGTVEEDLHAKTLTGNIKIGPVDGDATVGSNSGSIETGTVVGNLHAKTLTGNIETGPVYGDATVSSNSGRIETGAVAMDLHAKTLTGNIETGPVDGDATVSSATGRMKTGTVEGDLHAKTLTGKIEIGPVDGDANVSTTSGMIEASNVLGVCETRSLSGDIRLGPTRGDIVASSTSGDIEGELIVTDSSVEARYDMQTLSGDITIQMPVEIPSVIDAQITIGEIIDPWLPNWWHVQRRIKSDFDLNFSRIESSPGNYAIKGIGETNGGGNRIKLVSTAGNIRIRSKDDE